ncbi:neogenin-like, partial [Stegodyphus dumicola]|uniref:neogenin-like n=1 Tax=Stegodyphus dumicola TaxID=202533 RepID=UPI0015AB3A38
MANSKIFLIKDFEVSPVALSASSEKSAKKVCTDATANNPKNSPRFLVVSSSSGELQKMSPFVINKYIHSCIGEPKNIKRLRSGNLLMDTTSATQSASLLQITKLGNATVTVTGHKTLNYSRGVISEVDLLSVPEEEFVSELADQKVCAAKRIKMLKEGQLIDTKHVILTFKSPDLPKNIKAGYLNCPVRPYIPNPMRCFQCQRFGHSKMSCRGTLTCARCSSVGHDSDNCTAAALCGTNGFSDFQFLVEPHDTIVIKDHSTILNCSAAGNPSPVIGWKKDGALLELLQDDRRSILANGSLLFQRVLHSRTQRPDEGVYQCTAFLDGIGSIISREAKLQIASLPPFDKNPHNNSILEGQTAYFPCSIQGIPPATISWLRNEQILRLDQTRMTVFPSGALEIVSVSHSDEGMYRCVAVNADKSRESGAGALIVNTDYNELNRLSPHFIAKPPNTTVVTRGSHLTLDCAANGIPQPRITWLKDGTTVDLADLDSRYRIVGSGSLYIENVVEEDTGIYMCRAENAEDSVDTSAIVDILVPPYFVKRPENRNAYEKEDITLECEVYGKPVPILQWFKNGTSIIPSEYFQITSGNNLKIFGLVKSDSGIYQCFAKNSAGSIQASAQLVVFPS